MWICLDWIFFCYKRLLNQVKRRNEISIFDQWLTVYQRGYQKIPGLGSSGKHTTRFQLGEMIRLMVNEWFHDYFLSVWTYILKNRHAAAFETDLLFKKYFLTYRIFARGISTVSVADLPSSMCNMPQEISAAIVELTMLI